MIVLFVYTCAQIDRLEFANPDPNGQQLQKVMDLADFVIDNSGTHDEFLAALERNDAEIKQRWQTPAS